jgi:SAM-dependent methyltransferase
MKSDRSPEIKEFLTNVEKIRGGGDKSGAALCLAEGISKYPGDMELIQAFVDGAADIKLQEFDPGLKETVATVLSTENAEAQKVAGLWYTLLTKDPDFYLIVLLSSQTNYKKFKKLLCALSGKQNIADPVFLQGLKRLILPNLVLERWLTFLRHSLLEKDVRKKFDEKELIKVAVHLAHYCHYTGFIFDVTKDEAKQIKQIKKSVESAQSPEKVKYEIAILACYDPLCESPRASEIMDCLKDDKLFGGLVDETISDPLQEKEIAANIISITSVEDETSKKVCEQYTEFPYPRWKSLERGKVLSGYFEPLSEESLDILIAGCGTGQEAMYYSIAFPNSKILAVDLSRASLAYAIRKTGELGAKNIDFRQADILEMGGALDRKFDIISSSGVIHHMENPEKGFEVLDSLLKPGGFMRLCLYSSTGRRYIREAQKIIREKGYAGNAGGIRRFRRDCSKILPDESLKGICQARDFFIMQQCRDLLFHVMEHQFDISRIKSLLEKYDYEFLEFVVNQNILNKYHESFPDDPDAISLENWAEFETQNPDTFAAMYKFVCRKL